MKDTTFIYFDYAAATPLHPKVLEAMQPYFSEHFYNPSAPYQPARAVRQDIETARDTVAKIIGRRSTEVLFTAGATESINLALSVQGHIVTTAIEHPAVIETLRNRQHDEYTVVDADSMGRVDTESLKTALEPNTTLISVALVNNETGTIQDIKSISQLVREERAHRAREKNPYPLYLHTDASQAAGYIDLQVSRLGVDMMTLNGGKIYGPKQTGILYAHNAIKLKPVIRGGGQENGLRSGTENVAGIIGFSKALELAEKHRKSETTRLHGLRSNLLSQLENNFQDAILLGHKKHSSPHVLHMSFPGIDAERIVFRLEAQNILVATGSACSANKHTASPVLRALGLSDKVIKGSLRFSFGRDTTEAHMVALIQALKKAVDEEKQYA